MSIARLVILGWLSFPSGPEDAARLIEQLGAPKYADRESASLELVALGREALPALRLARDAKDPEVRARAVDLIGRIETDLMLRPTVVRLDYRDRPLPEVVEDLSRRTATNLTLMPENNPIWQGKRITLQAPEPITYWEMLDRLTRMAMLKYPLGTPTYFGGGRERMIVPLLADPNPEQLTTSDRGPFRTVLDEIELVRKRAFLGNQPNVPRNLPARVVVPLEEQDVVGRGTQVTFTVKLVVMVEPRMMLAQAGNVKLVEAVDELGRSLLVTSADDQAVQRYAGFAGAQWNYSQMPMVVVHSALRAPEQTGRFIKRLRGSLPVVISARKDEPTVIPLEEAKGKTIRIGDLAVTIQDVRFDAAPAGSTTIDLAVRSNATGGPAPGRFPFDGLASRMPQLSQSQLELRDAQGRAFPPGIPMSMRTTNEETQMSLRLMPNAALGAPTELRLYDLARVSTEAHFEFHDLPMP